MRSMCTARIRSTVWLGFLIFLWVLLSTGPLQAENLRINRDRDSVTSPGAISRYAYLVDQGRLLVVWEKKKGNRTALMLGAAELSDLSVIDREVELDDASSGNAICPAMKWAGDEIVVVWLLRRERNVRGSGEGRYSFRFAHLNRALEVTDEGELPFGDSLSQLELVSNSSGLFVLGVSRLNQSRYQQIRVFRKIGEAWEIVHAPSRRDRYSHQPVFHVEEDGKIHLVWSEQGPILYSVMTPGGDWSEPISVEPAGIRPLWLGKIEEGQALGLIWAKEGEDKDTTISASIFDESSEKWEVSQNRVDAGRRLELVWADFVDGNPSLVFHEWDLERECRYLAIAFLDSGKKLRTGVRADACTRAYTGRVERISDEKLVVAWRHDSAEGSVLSARTASLREQSWEAEASSIVPSQRFVRVSFPVVISREGETYLIYFEHKSVRGPLKPARPLGNLMLTRALVE